MLDWPIFPENMNFLRYIIEELKLLFSLRSSLSNLVVILNYITTGFLIICGFLLSFKEFFGGKIRCTHSTVSQIVVSQFLSDCQVDGSFSSVDLSKLVSNSTGFTSLRIDDGQITYEKCYQWAYMVLFLQALMFLVPKWIWQYIQDKRICSALYDVKRISSTFSVKLRLTQKIADLLNSNIHFFYAVISTELFCLFHVVFQIWATDAFLNGNFRSLGINWFKFYHGFGNLYVNPLHQIFPRQVNCDISLFTPESGLRYFDGICYLASNSANEKIFLVVWFWFHSLLAFVLTILVFRAFVLVSPLLRLWLLSWTGSPYASRKFHLLAKNPGTWFLLYILSISMETSMFILLTDKVIENHFDKKGEPLYHPVLELEIKKDKTRKKSSKWDFQEDSVPMVDWPDESDFGLEF